MAASKATRWPVLVVALALLISAACISACGSGVSAAGEFHAKHHDMLTVATGEIPLTGFWEGTAAHPTGGFEYELALDLARRFGLAHVKIVVVPFARIVAGDLGGADLALSDITATSEREQVLDFAGPYLPATPAVLVRAGTDVPDLKTAQQLTWAVGGSTTLHEFLDGTIQPDEHPLLTTSRKETLAAIDDHKVDAGLLDLPVAAAAARASSGRLSVAGQFDKNDDVSAALPQGSSNVQAVASAFRAFTADGTIASLAQRWLGLDLDQHSAADVPLIRTNS